MTHKIMSPKTTNNTDGELGRPKTFSEMTDAEKGALLLAEHEGKQIQTLGAVGNLSTERNWFDMETKPRWVPNCIYREKPEPEITCVDGSYNPDYGIVREYHDEGLINFKITLVDGEPADIEFV